MKIKEIKRQIRRDFWADFECEHCGHVVVDRPGYDDRYFHEKVVPDMECPNCGEKAPDTYRPLATKYADSEQV